MFGARAGLGMTPSGGGVMELDPVEELDAQDLGVPIDEEGKEIRLASEALRVCDLGIFTNHVY